jgi:hypothetical protein
MFDYVLGRIVLVAPSVLSILGIYLLSRFIYEWRMTVFKDRLHGLISDDRKGDAPTLVVVWFALTETLPLPWFYKLWKLWMEKHYGEDETLTEDEHKQMVLKVFDMSLHNRELDYWNMPLFFFLGPLLEELIFRTPLLVLFPTLSITAIVSITAVAIGFALLHWKSQVAFAAEDLMAWAENRDVRTTNSLRLMTVCIIFVLAMICGVAVVATQSLWVAGIIHGYWNFFIRA